MPCIFRWQLKNTSIFCVFLIRSAIASGNHSNKRFALKGQPGSQGAKASAYATFRRRDRTWVRGGASAGRFQYLLRKSREQSIGFSRFFICTVERCFPDNDSDSKLATLPADKSGMAQGFNARTLPRRWRKSAR